MSGDEDTLALECFFTTLAGEELGPCWFYEYLREFVLRMPSEQARDYLKDIMNLRALVQGKTAKEGRVILMEQHRTLPSLIPVAFEAEWPNTPYQAIPKDQRIQRLRDWLPEFFPNSTEYLLEDLLPFRMPAEVVGALATQLRDGKLPVVATEHVHSWIDFMLSQHALGSADYRMDTIYLRYVAAIIIDPAIGQAAFVRRAKALWQMLRGGEQQARKAGRPPDSLTAKNRPELQQLGAYRMVKVFGRSVEEAIEQVIDRLGDAAYYTDPRSFQRAIEETEKRLRKFFRQPDLNAE